MNVLTVEHELTDDMPRVETRDAIVSAARRSSDGGGVFLFAKPPICDVVFYFHRPAELLKAAARVLDQVPGVRVRVTWDDRSSPPRG